MSSHKWHFQITDEARVQIRRLTPYDRRKIFQSIRELLLADKPGSLQDVKKLVEPRFEDQWRKRQGDYRIFFTIDLQATEHQGFRYQGIITVLAVRHRSNAY